MALNSPDKLSHLLKNMVTHKPKASPHPLRK